MYKDLHNYVVTAPSIEGPWSEPIYLNSSGFDQFFYRTEVQEWQPIGPALYAGNLADSYQRKLSFTGAFVGLCVQDLKGTRLHADFDFFGYKEF